MQKDSAQAKILLKVVGGLLFLTHPVYIRRPNNQKALRECIYIRRVKTLTALPKASSCTKRGCLPGRGRVSRKGDVINLVTIRFAMPFPLAVHWNRASISNGFRDIFIMKIVHEVQENELFNASKYTVYLGHEQRRLKTRLFEIIPHSLVISWSYSRAYLEGGLCVWATSTPLGDFFTNI